MVSLKALKLKYASLFARNRTDANPTSLNWNSFGENKSNKSSYFEGKYVSLLKQNINHSFSILRASVAAP